MNKDKALISTFKKDLILVGMPGAGKGTQAKRLAKLFNMKHVSTGDVLRDHIKRGTKHGKLAEELEKEGKLFPSDKINEMMAEMYGSTFHTEYMILDGYPRTVDQVEYMRDEILCFNEGFKNDLLVIELGMCEDLAVKRISDRAKSSNRVDDGDVEIIKNRIQIYKDTTFKSLAKYDTYSSVNATVSPDAVTAQIIEVMIQHQPHLLRDAAKNLFGEEFIAMISKYNPSYDFDGDSICINLMGLRNGSSINFGVILSNGEEFNFDGFGDKDHRSYESAEIMMQEIKNDDLIEVLAESYNLTFF